MHTFTYVYVFVRLACSSAVCVLLEIRGSPAKAADTCIARKMHQTDLHLLGTAPPMPPPPLLQSLPEPPLIPGCGRRGRPARTTRTAWQRAAPPAWSAKIGTSKQASAEHRTTVCMHARHAHIAMHSAKQHRKPGMRYRASIALGTGRLCHAECSCRPGSDTSALDLRTQVRANAWPPP